MRLHSTPDSARKLEPTWLGILEVFFSLGILVVIAFYLETTAEHLAVLVLLAPLTLFRTERAERLGLRWLRHYSEMVASLRPTGSAFFALGAVLFVPLLGWTIRFATTVLAAVRHPLDAFMAMPGNWYRQTVCMDLFFPPEIVPGINSADHPRLNGMKFHSYPGLFRKALETVKVFDNLVVRYIFKVLSAVIVSTIGMLFYGPPLAYRAFFKTTSIVYAPFVWVFQSTLGHGLAGVERLQRIKGGELEKVRRKWAFFALTLLVAKALVLAGWLAPEYLSQRVPSPEVLAAFVVPERMPAWQLTVGVNCVLTFVLLWFTDAALPRLEQGTWSGRPVAGIVSALTLSRGLLSLYTVAAGFVIAWNELNFRAYFGI